MTKTVPKLFDLCYLEQMNNPDFVIQIIRLYLADTRKDLTLLIQAFEANQYEQLGNLAHKMKSSTGTIQANALYDLFEEIEKIARGRGEIKLLTRLINNAGFEFEKLALQLKLYLEQQ